MSLDIKVVNTSPYNDQNPGTSGLRRKVDVFTQENYVENFVQSFLDVNREHLMSATMILGGDGRYFCREAALRIIRMCAANRIAKVIVGCNGILSTPTASCLILQHKALGGIVLTASHNPGGRNGDFGIKFNCENGGPASNTITDRIRQLTTNIREYKIVQDLCIDIDSLGIKRHNIEGSNFVIEVIDPVDPYISYMRKIFDFDKLRNLICGTSTGKPLRILLDAMNGVTGPYIQEIFVKQLGATADAVMRTKPLTDFGGIHPDPNLTYAKDLVEIIKSGEYDIGAAFDGDGDRNMILGYKGFFVTPSDSLAIIAHYLECIPYFQRNGIQGFARSMPTAAAIDLVAKQLNKELFEVPTGWKYFGELMDAQRVCLCGEESFGIGSNHLREKDGIWAVLAWLTIMEHTGKTIEDIVRNHWKIYGRNYFQRYDYEECEPKASQQMMINLEKMITDKNFIGKHFILSDKVYKVKAADNFSFCSPLDKSITEKQGLRLIFEDNSRIIVRLSGTGSTGATIRFYVDRYERDNIDADVNDMLKPLIDLALQLSQLSKYTGRDKPTVVT